jgi:hypothetical protein
VATAKAMLNPDAPGYDDAPWLWSDQYQHNIRPARSTAPLHALSFGCPAAECRGSGCCADIDPTSDQYQHNIQILGIPQPGSRTIVREEALYFSLDDNGISEKAGSASGTSDRSRPAAIQRFASLTVRASLSARTRRGRHDHIRDQHRARRGER